MQERLQAFFGVRASLRSTKSGDARFGWVTDLYDGSLTLRFEDKESFDPNEAFVIELFGRSLTVGFAAIFTETTSSEFYMLYRSGALFSENALDLDFVDVEHKFRIASEFRFRPTSVPFRVAVGDVSASMEFVGPPVELNVLNIGAESIGCYSPYELDVNSKYQLRIGAAFGELRLEGTVAECHAIKENGSHYRVLFNISPAGRIHAARWRRFIDQQSVAA